jgi:uncharacterized phage protein gp47/JayE
MADSTSPVITPTSFQDLVQQAVDQWAAGVGVNPTLTPGDPLLAILQAAAAQAVYLQGLCNLLANFGRAQTAVGSQLDTWMAQFGFTRLPASAATGAVTLSTASVLPNNVIIPVGTIIQTSGGAVQYQLIADTNQTAYNASLNAYIILAGATSIMATAQCTTPGSAGNVAAGQLNQITSSVPGLSTVTNAATIGNGFDAESDTAFYNRWLQYLSSLSKATLAAIEAAIESVQTGLDFQVLDNTNNTGAMQYGFFTVVVDDGNLPPSSPLLAAITTAVDAVRAFTVQFVAMAPTIETVTIVLAIHPAAGAPGNIQTLVQTAIVNYVNSLPIGTSLTTSGLTNAALGVTGVVSVQSGITINGVNADFAITALQVARTSTGGVTVNEY